MALKSIVNKSNRPFSIVYPLPIPSVLAGDFNELPYSNNYRQLDSNFRSSFHQAGSGFDFTLNNLLFFLRIDHQFFGEGLEAVDYDVNRKARISDHFPTRALYRFE
ncbi:endonuclease/exonuclease/phosphatase family protein [Reichenbachiella ulvae]|uniref:endonuclease/exonuclease/phosphatase family protein n=1 Tax=Reichenbachiella ulvae TaxID=2980104 RepID=UPI00384E9177